MNMEYHELPLGQPLTEAYVKRNDPGVGELFRYHPAEDGDWHLRAEWLDASGAKRADAGQIAETLLAYNKRYGITELVESHIKKLSAGALTVAGGQQAGLWSGPMMIIHKAVSVIQ